jgi:hypothetical protein
MAKFNVKKIELNTKNKRVVFTPGELDQPEILEVIPKGDRLYELDDMRVDIWTSEYHYSYLLKKGFVTNFRSGGFMVDFFIDQIGDQIDQLCWICHDAAYTPCEMLRDKHPVTRYEADNLLRAMLRFAGVSKAKYQLVYYNLRTFGGSAYSKDDDLTPTNKKLFSFSKEKL